MNKTKNIIGIIALIVFVLGGAYFVMKAPAPAPAQQTDTTSSLAGTGTSGTAQKGTTGTTGGTTGSASSPSAYTLAQVAEHSDQSSCWTTINGNVYNLTTWIGQHPGGEGAILSICGKDGTSAFEAQHATTAQAQAMLATFKIGTLKK